MHVSPSRDLRKEMKKRKEEEDDDEGEEEPFLPPCVDARECFSCVKLWLDH